MDYEERYYKTLDKMYEVRRERDVLFKALAETQRQLELARAIIEGYRREREAGDDDEQ